MKLLDELGQPLFKLYTPVSDFEILVSKLIEIHQDKDGTRFLLYNVSGNTCNHVCYFDEEKQYLIKDPGTLLFSKKGKTDFTIATSNFLDFLALEKLKINAVYFTNRIAHKLAEIPVYYILDIEGKEPSFPCSLITTKFSYKKLYEVFDSDTLINEKRNKILKFIDEATVKEWNTQVEIPYRYQEYKDLKTVFEEVYTHMHGDKIAIALLLGWHVMALYKEHLYSHFGRFPLLYLQGNYIDIGLFNSIIDELFKDKGVVVNGLDVLEMFKFNVYEKLTRVRVENFIDTYSTSLGIKHKMGEHYMGKKQAPVIYSGELMLQDPYLRKCTIISQHVDYLPENREVPIAIRDYRVLNKVSVLSKHIHNISVSVTIVKFWEYYKKFEELREELSKGVVGFINETMENYTMGFVFAKEFMDIEISDIIEYMKRVMPTFSMDPCMNILGSYLYLSLWNTTADFPGIIGGSEKEIYVDFVKAIRMLRESGTNIFMNEYRDLKVYLSTCPYFIAESYAKTYNGFAGHLSTLDRSRLPADIIILLDKNCDKYRDQFTRLKGDDRENNRSRNSLSKLRT